MKEIEIIVICTPWSHYNIARAQNIAPKFNKIWKLSNFLTIQIECNRYNFNSRNHLCATHTMPCNNSCVQQFTVKCLLNANEFHINSSNNNFTTYPIISTTRQKTKSILPYCRILAWRMINNRMYSMPVNVKLYRKSVPSVKYDNAKPQIIDEMCWHGNGISTEKKRKEKNKWQKQKKCNEFLFG